MTEALTVRHKTIDLDGVETFYREAGSEGAPVVLLPHGYPCSSYEFRNFMPALADHWRLLAPDFPGCGYSATPADFPYDFDGYARFLERFSRSVHDASSSTCTTSARRSACVLPSNGRSGSRR